MSNTWVGLAADIARQTLAPQAAHVDRTGAFPREGVKALAASGLLGLMVPRAYGGQGEGPATCARVLEELAAGCASTAAIYLFHSQVVRRLLDVATPAQQERCLPGLAAGKLGASSWTEPGSGADKHGLATTAVRSLGGFAVSGRKSFCTGAGEAAIYTVLVRMPGAGNREGEAFGRGDQAFVILHGGMPGLSFGGHWDGMGLRGTATGELICERCRVPADQLLGAEGDGPRIMALNRRSGLHPGLIGLGIARAALDAASQYVGHHGHGQHQAVRFMLAEADMRLAAARALAYEAADLAQAGAPEAGAASLRAKVVASEAAVAVTDLAVQLFGGRGYLREYPAERHYRDARALALMGPTSELCREMLGRYRAGLGGAP